MITSLLLAAEKTVEELLNEGQYIDAALKSYTDSIGTPIFYGLFLLGIAGAFIIRNQSFTPILVFVIITFTIVITVIPPNAFGLVMGVILLVGSAILYRLFVREKRP